MNIASNSVESPRAKLGTFAVARRCRWVACGVTLLLAAGCSTHQCPAVPATEVQTGPHDVRPASTDPELQLFLEQHHRATNRILNGDSASWKELASQSDEATLFPPFGGVARGWAEVSARYDAAAARRPSGNASTEIELHASGVSGDLAYVVWFERSAYHKAGSDALHAGFTRVTHILRREEGQWKLLHRHMDHLPETFVPPGN